MNLCFLVLSFAYLLPFVVPFRTSIMAESTAPRGTLFRSSGQKDRLSGQIPMSERRDPMICPGNTLLTYS